MHVVVAREASAEAVTVHGVTVTPRSRTLVVRWPNGGLVWSRPTAVLVEHGGQLRRVAIVDVTRVLQVGLVGVAALAAGVRLLGCRDRMEGAA